jgi:maltose alpha-D-glucosyltransferase / alpha-amylase
MEEGEAAQWAEATRQLAERTLARLAEMIARLPQDAAAQAERLLTMKTELLRRIDAAGRCSYRGVKLRYHGRYELDCLLISNNDFLIARFDDGPWCPDQRHARVSPLWAVAAMLRSLGAAAQRVVRSLEGAQIGDPEVYEGLAVEWLDRAKRALLEGYAESVADLGIFEPDRSAAAAVLQLFGLDLEFRELDRALERHPEAADASVAALLAHLDSGSELLPGAL